MAGLRLRDRACERAHAWASLELDGELSQLERALLTAHLRRCRACAASVAEMRAITAAMREAPRVRPEQPVFAAGKAGAGAWRAATSRLAVAAALAAAAAALGVFAGSIGGDGADAPAPSQPDIALRPSADDRRDDRDRPPGGKPRPGQVTPSPDRVGGV